MRIFRWGDLRVATAALRYTPDIFAAHAPAAFHAFFVAAALTTSAA
jgi:hypothetical protein